MITSCPHTWAKSTPTALANFFAISNFPALSGPWNITCLKRKLCSRESQIECASLRIHAFVSVGNTMLLNTSLGVFSTPLSFRVNIRILLQANGGGPRVLSLIIRGLSSNNTRWNWHNVYETLYVSQDVVFANLT
jgi:hypothetical protein